jgi:hypothetical protein
MPYVISGDTDEDRFVITERTREFFTAFYAPPSWGEPLTPELQALTPDPYYVKPEGGMPEIFGENLGVWTIKDSVKQIIDALAPGIHTFIPVNLRVRG